MYFISQQTGSKERNINITEGCILATKLLWTAKAKKFTIDHDTKSGTECFTLFHAGEKLELLSKLFVEFRGRKRSYNPFKHI